MAEPQFDVFLCHNSEDKPAVIEIAKQLQQNNLKPWLDVWELRPGAIWQFVLEQQIENIGAAAVFVGEQGLGPWQEQEIYAFLQEFMRRRCPVIPVLLSDAPQRPRLPIFLKNCHWVDFRTQDPDPMAQLIWGVTGQKPTTLLTTAKVIDTAEVAKEVSPSTNTQDELAALREELERLKAQQAIKTSAQATSAETDREIELKSEKGLDYTRLRDLLKAKDWQAADKETAHRMLEAVGRKENGWIRAEELANFPCADLQTIDRLWVKYSDKQFGFSVQKQIYVECGGKLDGQYPGDKIWGKFGDRVGWRVNGVRLYYSAFTFDTSAPSGHLPRIVGSDDWGVVFSRIQTCKL